MATRYQVDHVGNVLRPSALLEARAAYAEGRLGLDALRQAEDAQCWRRFGYNVTLVRPIMPV